jgi:hypothetical protein
MREHPMRVAASNHREAAPVCEGAVRVSYRFGVRLFAVGVTNLNLDEQQRPLNEFAFKTGSLEEA